MALKTQKDQCLVAHSDSRWLLLD